jgi:SAM-dependent methyltransferase
MKRRLILGLLASPAWAWCAQDDDRIWADYLSWFRSQTRPVTGPRSAYIAHLRKTGITLVESQRRSGVVEQLMRERKDEWQSAFFDHTYTAETTRFNTNPNALLVETVKALKPGRALDIHMGQGRNAIFLARQGWQVTGFDFSAEGIAAARRAAKHAEVTISAIVARHEEFDFGVDQWDLIVMSYTWVPLEARWIDRISRSLRPGGLLVFEHLMEESGSDGAAAWLPKANELPRLFGQLRILRYEDIRARADWSWRPERIARLVAERDLAIEQLPLQER